MSTKHSPINRRIGLGAWLDLDPDGAARIDGDADASSPWHFPCRFPIKAMGRADSDLVAVVLDIVVRHAPETTAAALQTRRSSGGKWLAVTVTIEAQSRDQLDAIYRELTAHELVAYAL